MSVQSEPAAQHLRGLPEWQATRHPCPIESMTTLALINSTLRQPQFFQRGVVSLAAALLFAPTAWADADGAARSEAETEAVALEKVEVFGEAARPVDGYRTNRSRSATRTDTLLIDVPQSVTVVTREQVQDQSVQSLGDLLRYVPGVGAAQGEGHRDAPILRGNTSTSDLFVNGVRDDVQYYRDLYNIDRVEVLKGPNAMVFGRGGVGGVINRVTREANGERIREITLQGGSFDNRRASFDLGGGTANGIAARVTGVYENSGSYRDDVELERYGLNPTLRLATGKNTTFTLGTEYFRDDRTTDRGVPSQNGKPFPSNDSSFFGDPSQSEANIELSVSTLGVEHRFDNGVTLVNRLSYGNYDKTYQNVFASGPVSSSGTVPNQAYVSSTDRRNLFNQTDISTKLMTGSIRHTLLAGAELGRQVTDNLRLSGPFADGADADSEPDSTFVTTVANANFREPIVAFVQGGSSDGNNLSTAKIAALYVQDQIAITEQLEAVVGLRYDRFEVDFNNRRSDATAANRQLSSEDNLLSPRAGLIYKPMPKLAVYTSYSLSYLPRAGEQLNALSPTSAALDPEEFTNYELGAKWDFTPQLALTAAVYQLDRSNVILVNPTPGGATILGDGARSKGVELGISGRITSAWSVAGGYAYQDAKLTGTANASSAQDGARLAQTPKHSFSLWNRYDLTPQWGAGLGFYNRSKVFATTSNAVQLDGYSRLDGAVFYTVSPTLGLQLNVENLTGEDYAVSAHNDNNILPGAPLSVRLGLTARF